MNLIKPGDLVMCVNTTRIEGAGNGRDALRKLRKDVLYVVMAAHYCPYDATWDSLRVADENGPLAGTYCIARFVKIGSI